MSDDDDTQDPPTPTPEEVKAWKEKAAKLDESEKTKTELEAKLKEVETDEQNINWKKAREREKRLLAALKSSGKNVDEEGNLLDEPKGYTEEEFEKKSKAQIEKVLIEKEIARVEKKMAETDRPIFRKAYEKAIHNEEVTSENVEEFLNMALSFAGQKKPTTTSDRAAGTRGGIPIFEEPGKDFSETPEGEAAFNKMWPSLGAKKTK